MWVLVFQRYSGKKYFECRCLIVKADFFFASRFWEDSYIDYAIFLLRRSSKSGRQMLLNKEEIVRFYDMQKHLGFEWKEVVQGAEKQKNLSAGLFMLNF